MNDRPSSSGRHGLLHGLAAYGLWGLMPLYFKAVGGIPPLELLAHRVLWSCVVLAALLSYVREWPALLRAVRSRPTRRALLASSALIAVNWLAFIYAVSIGQVLQTSLGYFITPLVNVLLGMLVLGERLRQAQWLAVAVAALGVVVLAVAAGEVPWIALALAASFGTYGLLRKTAAVGSLVGLTVETLILVPLAAGYLIYLGVTGQGAFGMVDRVTDQLLILSGPATTLPLLCFAVAVQRLPLSTMGFLQYIAPSCSFLLAVFVFGETLRTVQVISFGLIWTALAVFSVSTFLAARKPAEEPVIEGP